MGRKFDHSTAAVRQVEERYRTLFDESPISLWEEDLSACKARLDELSAEHTDLARFFDRHPDAVFDVVSRIRVVDVNKATLRLYDAASREDLLGRIGTVIAGEMASADLGRSMLAVAAGETAFEIETVNRTLHGEKIDIFLKWRVDPGHAGDYSRVMVSIIDITERKRAEEALRRSREELRNLAAYRETAREEERTRIAREIHDLLGQDLTALKLDVAWLRQRLPAGEELLARKADAMMSILDATAQTVRRISRELRPALLDDLGLVEAIALHVQEFRERTGIACEFLPSGGEPVMGREPAIALFRIAQEALTNVARHAGAKRVSVVLDSGDGEATLRVSDDGRGIRPEELTGSKSFGLMGIRERVGGLRGTVSITGMPGEGTTVIATIPYRKEGEGEC
jgi:PAS domain S-box-containing protein